MVEQRRTLATQTQAQEDIMRKIEQLTSMPCWMLDDPKTSVYKVPPVWR